MTAEFAARFEALEAQAQRIMAIFTAAGYEAVAPALIQPAETFLEVVGEALRARTYVFTDPDGTELCLRPDLTVPTCLLHLERLRSGAALSGSVARYCYNGPAFRFQPATASAAHPREFRQAGIEIYGEPDRARADIEVLRLTLDALAAAGLARPALRIGDIAIFHALLDALEMPARWRDRLRHLFWRPEAFRTELKRMGAPAAERPDIPASRLLAGIGPEDAAGASARLAEHLDKEGLEVLGARSLDDVAASLLAAVEDRAAAPLPAGHVALIECYLAVEGPARAAGARLKDLAREHAVDISAAIEAYHARVQSMAEIGVDLATTRFSAEFGRSFEYYTGFVFEVVAPGLGRASPVAGGGRYDGLIASISGAGAMPAVGVAIHTERLLAIAAGGTP